MSIFRVRYILPLMSALTSSLGGKKATWKTKMKIKSPGIKENKMMRMRSEHGMRMGRRRKPSSENGRGNRRIRITDCTVFEHIDLETQFSAIVSILGAVDAVDAIYAIDTVDLGGILVSAYNDGELPASICTNNTFPANGRVVDNGGRVNVVNGALASLVVAGKAPRVHLAVLCDSEAVVRPGGNRVNVVYCICKASCQRRSSSTPKKKKRSKVDLPSSRVGFVKMRANPLSSKMTSSLGSLSNSNPT